MSFWTESLISNDLFLTIWKSLPRFYLLSCLLVLSKMINSSIPLITIISLMVSKVLATYSESWAHIVFKFNLCFFCSCIMIGMLLQNLAALWAFSVLAFLSFSTNCVINPYFYSFFYICWINPNVWPISQFLSVQIRMISLSNSALNFYLLLWRKDVSAKNFSKTENSLKE